MSINVYIHYTDEEAENFELAAKSAKRFSSVPLNIYKLDPNVLKGTGAIVRDNNKFARYFIPHFHKYKGHAVFLDSHVIFRADIAQLVYQTGEKAIGISQTYLDNPFIVWNCSHRDNKKLFPNSINMDQFFTLGPHWWTGKVHFFDDSWCMDSLIYYRDMEKPQEYGEELLIKEPLTNIKHGKIIKVDENTNPEIKPICTPCSKKAAK